MISKNKQYLKKWPAGVIEIVNVVRIVWKVEDPWCKGSLKYCFDNHHMQAVAKLFPQFKRQFVYKTQFIHLHSMF